jgi:hypothetical protein
MQRSSRLLLILSVLVLSTGIVTAQEPARRLSEEQMAGVIRTINASQMTWQSVHKTWASLRDLEHDKYLSARGLPINYTSNDSAKIEGYDLRVIVSSDGKRYSTTLAPTTGCGIAMFSDELGVIYQATAFGCEQTAQSSLPVK